MILNLVVDRSCCCLFPIWGVWPRHTQFVRCPLKNNAGRSRVPDGAPCDGAHRSDDRRAADADAKEQDAKLSTCEKWKAHDRFAKIFFMIIYLIINIALWIHWAYNA